VANIVVVGIIMKEEPNVVTSNLKFFILIVESSFINLCDPFDKNGPSLLNVIVVSLNW
jgi:hypothetical protein